jgi:hypothetical protein
MMQAALQAGHPPTLLKRRAISSELDDLQRKRACRPSQGPLVRCARRLDDQSQQLAGMADAGPLNAWSSRNASTMQRTDAEAQRSLRNARRIERRAKGRMLEPTSGWPSIRKRWEIWRRKEELAGPPRRPAVVLLSGAESVGGKG